MFVSFPFWAIALPLFALVRLVPAEWPRRRSALYAAAGIVGALVVLDIPWFLVAMLVAAVVWLVAALRAFVPQSVSRPNLATALIVAPVIVPWVLGKQAVAMDVAHVKILYFAGFSFFLIKAWTLTKDVCDGRVRAFDPVIAAAYFFHLPTYLSGPMHYYPEFENAVRKPLALEGGIVLDAVFRFLWGIVKVSVLAVFLAPMSLVELAGGDGFTLRQLVFGAFVYSLVLYFDFSGYSDMAIAISRLLGIDTPENFRQPYLAPNIRDFWQRWHITFSRVLTGYIFIPLSRNLQRRLGGSPRPVMTIGYLVTFGFAGYWHGPTLNFVVWGLYHAAGLIAYDLFRSARPKAVARSRQQSRLYALVLRAVSVAVTFVFVSLGWIFFVMPLQALG